MPITINGSGTLTGVSVGGLPDGIVDEDMLAAESATAAKRGPGSVLQVVHTDFTSGGTITVISTTNSTTYQDTNCTRSITPLRSDSSILIIAHNQIQANVLNGGTAFRLERNGDTALYPAGSDGGLFHYSSGNDLGTDTLVYLDTTGSWSGAQTYLVQFKSNGNGSAFTAAFSMTLMEIAA